MVDPGQPPTRTPDGRRKRDRTWDLPAEGEPAVPFKVRLASRLAGWLNRLMTCTCRQVLVRPTYAERRARGEDVRCIYAAWHSYLWHGTRPLEDQDACVMVSSHKDGELIARMLGRRGFRLARGSSTRGGARALREITRAARAGSDLVITVDGPKGPPRRVKPGILTVAALTGLPVVPMGMWVSRVWRLGTWDRLIVGKPFSTVVISYGEPIPVPRDVGRGELEEVYRARVEAAIEAEEANARRVAEQGGGSPS